MLLHTPSVTPPQTLTGSAVDQEEPPLVSGTQPLTTLKDIAAATGVSVGTVSNALNGRPNVGPKLRERIMRAAKQLGYQPNRAAQTLRTGHTSAIGLVLPDLTNPFYPELA